ncbi:GGDEF domain-containing protein [Caldicellulosiruptor danielii]|uniref:GGDEF domain-containing protein n=1 Tax=Anaerocellum danielii TaxID=1387557 RepID=A0ABZ0U4A0_9FIRM|nr:GGDEF domain-containing protein [Caldicellulosiruptor danielii]WPX09299.1 GGDEF domain-containing protein [Caldicellulosiruptor danielii]
MHNLSRFSSEVLKEKFDVQRSFELLVDFIYEIYSKTFPRICFYYQQEDGNYKLVIAKDESESIKSFEEVEVSIQRDAKIKDINHISIFGVQELEKMLECKQLKSMLSDIYRSVVFVPIRRYNKLVGFLLCYSRMKDFKMTDEEKEGLIVFVNFSQALLSQIERIEKIRNLSTEDELTGLYNRRYFMKELILESITADRYKNKFCVAFFDMDNLKLLNDFYGHNVGDKAIRMIGRIIRDNIRKTDIPARLGGDEFAVIFKNCNKDAIEDRIKNIKQLIEKESELQLPKKIKVSCGVAVYPDDTTSLDELLKIADMRMYDEKLKSKGGDFDAERQ